MINTIKVEVTEDYVNVTMPVPKDPDDLEERAKCMAAIVEDLVYIYKTIEEHYDSDILDFILKLAAKTFTFQHDNIWEDNEREIK